MKKFMQSIPWVLTVLSMVFMPVYGHSSLNLEPLHSYEDTTFHEKKVEGILHKKVDGSLCSIILEDEHQEQVLVPFGYKTTASGEAMREALMRYVPCGSEEYSQIVHIAERAVVSPIQLASAAWGLRKLIITPLGLGLSCVGGTMIVGGGAGAVHNISKDKFSPESLTLLILLELVGVIVGGIGVTGVRAIFDDGTKSKVNLGTRAAKATTGFGLACGAIGTYYLFNHF